VTCRSAIASKRLCFRRSAIDLVAKQEVGEDRPRLELEATRWIAQHVDAGDVRWHEVGGELNAREAKSERRGQRSHEQCLRRTRYTLDEHMAAREKGHQRIGDCVILPDHACRNGRPDALEEHGALGWLISRSS
jgi:hypothetical protein